MSVTALVTCPSPVRLSQKGTFPLWPNQLILVLRGRGQNTTEGSVTQGEHVLLPFSTLFYTTFVCAGGCMSHQWLLRRSVCYRKYISSGAADVPEKPVQFLIPPVLRCIGSNWA